MAGALAFTAALAMASPASAQLLEGYPRCAAFVTESFNAAMASLDKENEEERLLRRLERLRRAAETIPAMTPQVLESTAQTLRGVAAGDRPAGPGEDAETVAKRHETVLVAQAMLELIGERQAAGSGAFDPMAGAFGRRIREGEAERARVSAELGALFDSADAARHQADDCYRQAGAPPRLSQATPPSTPGAFTDLSGDWQSQTTPQDAPRAVSIWQNADYLVLNIGGGAVRAATLKEDRLEAIGWRGDLIGRLSPDRREIRWSNGMVWRRR